MAPFEAFLMSRATQFAVCLLFFGLGAIGCNQPTEITSSAKETRTRGFEFEIGPSETPPTLLTAAECEIRIEETEAFTEYYRQGRLVLKVQKNSKRPTCLLYGPDGHFGAVVLNKPESPSVSIERGIELHVVIETLPDKSLSLVALDGDPNAFFESYVLTSSSVSLLDASAYAERVNEVRTLTSAFQLHIRQKDEE
jgi:hypothetical protein